MKTTRKAFTIGSLLGLALVGTAAMAGLKNEAPVEVGTTYGYGAVGSARNSADGVQSIHCYGWSFGSAGTPNTSCVAKNSAGTQLACSTNSTFNLATVTLSMNSDSLVYFEIPYAGSSQCSYLAIGNHSQYPPKKP